MKIGHIRKAKEFSEVFEAGKRISGRRICLYVARSPETEITLVGIVLSRKCEPKAVRRNYIRRLTYQFFKDEAGRIGDGVRVIVRFQGPIYEKQKKAISQMLKAELDGLVKKAGIL